jgi:hypothetical protein
LYRRLGIRGSVAACLEDLADVAARDQPIEAVRLFAAADAMRSTNATPPPHPERDRTNDGWLRCGTPQRAGLRAAWINGHAMTLDSAVNEAKAVGAPTTM